VLITGANQILNSGLLTHRSFAEAAYLLTGWWTDIPPSRRRSAVFVTPQHPQLYCQEAADIGNGRKRVETLFVINV